MEIVKIKNFYKMLLYQSTKNLPDYFTETLAHACGIPNKSQGFAKHFL